MHICVQRYTYANSETHTHTYTNKHTHTITQTNKQPHTHTYIDINTYIDRHIVKLTDS